MPPPICFMIMPFGTKDAQPPAGSPAGTWPAKINFDALWEKAFAPAIEALGYKPVRADQDLGALIIQEMLERLYFSDLVLADMTLPNGNVYYEVGIRHAAKAKGCVLLAANWSQALFDVNQMRRVPYPLPEGRTQGTGPRAARQVSGHRRRSPPWPWKSSIYCATAPAGRRPSSISMRCLSGCGSCR